MEWFDLVKLTWISAQFLAIKHSTLNTEEQWTKQLTKVY